MIRLCSASQSRALLLKKFGIEFVQSPVEYDEESLNYATAREFVYHASKGKLAAAEGPMAWKYPCWWPIRSSQGPTGLCLERRKTGLTPRGF